MLKIHTVLVVLLLLAGPWLCFLYAQSSKVENILENIERVQSSVNDYVANIQVDVDMERIQIPRSKAVVYFKKPNKIFVESKQFALVPREALLLNPKQYRERYIGIIKGSESIGTMTTTKILLTAKDDSVRLKQAYIWVNPSNWTIVKMETVPFEGRKLTLTLSYALQERQYWMPDTVVARFESEAPQTQQPLELSQDMAPMTNEMRRPPRKGTVRLVYSNYKINLGIEDAVFEKKEKK
jgi:outer membrane lipoprotein-sorting protein